MVSGKDIFIEYHLVDVIFVIILIIIWALLQNANPNRLYIPPGDPRCSYPRYDSGIKEMYNLIVAISIPYVVYTILYVILKTKGALDGMIPFDYLLVIISHSGCIIMANILSNIIKLQIGRPRPDFFATLGIEANSETPKPEDMATKTYIECFKSFPSGHTTTASCGSLFFFLFLQHGIDSSLFVVFFLKFLPLGYAFYIGMMRITEHRHHIEDVLAGMMIGFLISFCFFQGQHDRIFLIDEKP